MCGITASAQYSCRGAALSMSWSAQREPSLKKGQDMNCLDARSAKLRLGLLVMYMPSATADCSALVAWVLQECINSWLKRNCTCPLCKCNVLEAFKRTPQRGQQRASQRHSRPGIAPLPPLHQQPHAARLSQDGSETSDSSRVAGSSADEVAAAAAAGGALGRLPRAA